MSLFILNEATLHYHNLTTSLTNTNISKVSQITDWARNVADVTAITIVTPAKRPAPEQVDYVADEKRFVEPAVVLSAAPLNHLGTCLPPSRPVKRQKLMMTSSPADVLHTTTWCRVFIPTYLQYLARRDANDAWLTTETEAIFIMQKVWDYLYGSAMPYTVECTGYVFAMVNQRTGRWRSAFGIMALTALDTFFSGHAMDTDRARQDYARVLLVDYLFLYAVASYATNGELKRKGIFGSSLIIQTFGTYFSSIHNATSIPSLDLDLDSPTSGVLSKFGRPAIALALSTAAVERGLKLWRDGYMTCELSSEGKTGGKKRASTLIKPKNMATGRGTRSTDFNCKNWRSATNGYLASIKRNLSENSFDVIVAATMAFTKTGRYSSMPLDSWEKTSSDEHAVLADD